MSVVILATLARVRLAIAPFYLCIYTICYDSHERRSQGATEFEQSFPAIRQRRLVDVRTASSLSATYFLAIHRDHDHGITAAAAIGWASVLLQHGASPGNVTGLMDGGWSGEESEHYKALRTALEHEPVAEDGRVEGVRQSDIKRFAAAERAASEREQRERVTGRIQ